VVSVIKRIISFVLVIAILICFAVPFAYAATEYSSASVSLGELKLHDLYVNSKNVWNENSPLPVWGRLTRGLTTKLLYNDICEVSADSYHACSEGMTFDENAIGWDDYGKYYLLQCNYCDKWFRCYSSDIFDAYDEYVNTLSNPVISGSNISLPFKLDAENAAYFRNMLNGGYILDYEIEPNSLTYIMGKYANYSITYKDYSWYPSLGGHDISWYTDEFYIGEDGTYTFSFVGAEQINCCNPLASTGGLRVERYVDGEWVDVFNKTFSPSAVNDGVHWHHLYNSLEFTVGLAAGYKYRVHCGLRGGTAKSDNSGAYNGISGSVQLNNITIGNGDDTFVPSANTRPVSLMQTINNYNNDNSYTDNSTTNYFIGIVDDNGEVTDVYNPTVYDETTKIFTEPVTGAQYQTSGWTYNYLSRTYDIALSDSTFLIGATPVSRIELTYGDEAVTLVYYDANNNILGHDDYAYVAVAKDECTLYGHSYTYETIKDATCTEMGERKYTCSRCGNEYAEEIPLAEHTFKVEEKVNTEYGDDGTISVYGYTKYKCEVCGEEKLENDEVDVTDESWFKWLGTQFRKLGSGLVGGLSDGLEYLTGTVIKSVTDWSLGLVEWLFGLVDGDLLSTWYSWFNEDNPYINQELEKDGTEVDSIWA